MTQLPSRLCNSSSEMIPENIFTTKSCINKKLYHAYSICCFYLNNAGVCFFSDCGQIRFVLWKPINTSAEIWWHWYVKSSGESSSKQKTHKEHNVKNEEKQETNNNCSFDFSFSTQTWLKYLTCYTAYKLTHCGKIPEEIWDLMMTDDWFLKSLMGGSSWWWHVKSSWGLWSSATWCHQVCQNFAQRCSTCRWGLMGHRHQTTSLHKNKEIRDMSS